nr:protein THEMIS isoform X2 [Peromyscus maniculatus bairdii]
MALSLEEFVHSLDLRTLPRVLEIQSGIYFEGSIYEMFGNECCLSTGEVIKITGLKIKKIMAEICEDNTRDSASQKPFELPMNFPVQKDIVRILPSLDVEVKDITDSYDANWFLQLLSTEDLFEMTSKEFPIVAEVIEVSQGNQLSPSILQPGKTIVIHKKYQASRILASEIRSNFPKRHFLIPSSYKGKFKRRPREFPTAYDLQISKTEKETLHVVATKAFHTLHKELSSVSVGDQFLVHHSETTEVVFEGTRTVNVLACEKILNKSYEAARLPLYMEGGFVEVIHDKKQYQLSELCTQFRWPFNVKVSVRDLFIKDDILAATPGLQLEEDITDSYLLVSDFANPGECWEIPMGRLNMTVQLVSSSNLSMDTGPIEVRTLVEEITEEQYYMMRRYESSLSHPPPRPPKHPSAEEMKLTLLSLAEERTGDLPKSPKSHHADRAKKLHPDQGGPHSRIPVGFRNDLPDVERQKSKHEPLQ